MRRTRVAGLLVVAALAASCAAGPEPAPTAAPDRLCGIGEETREEGLLRAVLRSERFQPGHATTGKIIQHRLEQELRQMKPGSSTAGHDLCHYVPEPPDGARRLTIELDWTPPGLPDRSGVPRERYTQYTVNGVRAEATDIIATFRVACALPGDLEERSRKAQLRFTLGNTVNMGRDEPETQKRHIAFLYVMAQRATDALGCENEPLRGEPVVTPGGQR